MGSSNRQRARELLSDISAREDSDYYIYVLELRRYDNETFYYVGLTSNILNRITTHISNKNVYMPTTMGEMRCDIDYEIVSVIEVIDIFGTRERARNMERTRAFEIAIELESTNVLGGS